MEVMLTDVSLFSVGLALIVVSWIAQIVYMFLHGKKFYWGFAFLQLTGIVFLIYHLESTSGVRDLSYCLQILSGVGALASLLVVLFKKK